MKKLTIKRESVAPENGADSYVYLEDPAGGNVLIDGAACRLLGKAECGKESVFDVGETDAAIYIVETGRRESIYAPASPETFEAPEAKTVLAKTACHGAEGASPYEVTEKTDKGGSSLPKALIIAIIILLAAGFIAGVTFGIIHGIKYQKTSKLPKQLSEGGMNITLPGEFRLQKDPDNNFCALSDTVSVYGERVLLNQVPELNNKTALNYAKLMKKKLGVGAGEVRNLGSRIYLEYEYTESDGQVYRYRIYFFKTTEAFWTVSFGVARDKFDSMTDYFDGWIGTVSFDY
jgi:hypothetical protein